MSSSRVSLAPLLSLLLVALSTSTMVGMSGAAAYAEEEVVHKPGLEKLALRLLNCNRTGGKIRRDGTCKARGSGRYSTYRKPLARHGPIAVGAARPWARTMILEDACEHELPGHPGVAARLADAGYGSAAWGENIACTWGYSTRDMVIWASRAFQAERKSGGGHWRNLKSRSFRSVGIGIAKRGSTSTIVFDFYGLRAP